MQMHALLVTAKHLKIAAQCHVDKSNTCGSNVVYDMDQFAPMYAATELISGGQIYQLRIINTILLFSLKP
ncbi:hypothetical protein NECAME_18722 [Necator americanus]|uniref:Uncharacterized protein n=1 Tax=Necator americanus TaxID=51031 RepID=W2SSE9_NECAM|nr:hypothetical protein NECAME_18722 [Necator americanus]ETN72679.1 hypothetical protein NECAME_18722 [Necator americanus]